MLQTSDLALNFGNRKLFEGVNLKFTPGNCYGIIGANGAGKSTFLKLLGGSIDPSRGEVVMPKNLYLSTLKQDHFAFNDVPVLEAVIRGHEKLWQVMKEKDALYAKPDFSDEDGVRAAELEAAFAEMEGWEAESEAAILLSGLGLGEDLHGKLVKQLTDDQVVKVLLAQALFGKPDVLLLDEPTNHLDTKAILWLEEFLLNFKNTVIVVSHDRHFLNKVCTHIVDIDFQKATLYVGNYDFWQQSSELAVRLRGNRNKRVEEKVKELEAFIRRFSANASKSKQATSRRKQLDKLTIEDLPISIRKHPHVVFEQDREAGDVMLIVKDLKVSQDGETMFENLSFEINPGDKVLFAADNEKAVTALFDVLLGHAPADAGEIKWGVTTSQSYLPKDHNHFFADNTMNLIDWLREFSEDKSENFVRSFLGRMLFSGEETKKEAQVLSGGEKVRCMLSRMMLQKANVLVLDGPTNHLDLESITALNNGLIKFSGTVLFATHDQEFSSSLSTRVIKISPEGPHEYQRGYDEYLADQAATLASN